MTGGSLGLRTGSYGSLQQQTQNGAHNLFITRTKPSKISLSGSREKDRIVCCLFRYLGRRKVGMLILVSFALLAFTAGFLSISREEAAESVVLGYFDKPFKDSSELMSNTISLKDAYSHHLNTLMICGEKPSQLPNFSSTLLSTTTNASLPVDHPCQHFAFPPPPIGYRTRIGPRPCPVCYVPVEHAIASMPKTRSSSPLIHRLTYFHDENPIKDEPHGGSDFGGYPSLKQRNESYTVKESMTVHCGFIKGCRPGQKTGFDIDVADLMELEKFHDVIVASAIFGNYDIIQEPLYISKTSRENVPFYMFIDEETEAYMKNASALNSHNRVGLWRIIVVRNVPYADARRNGKVPKLLLHRLFPNVRYSIWIDGKLQLVADPYQILERFLWRQNATFAISRHYRRFDVFEEAEANKAAGKYDNSSIDYQIDFYEKEGLTRYSEAKLPITSDVPEGCVIIKEHTSITNLFTCLWFNEVDRFTSRDQLSFSTVRDKLMSQAKNWSINMFMDCERRNFVKQAYHKDLLDHTPPPASVRSGGRPSSAVVRGSGARRPPVKKGSVRRGRKSGSRRHRKVVAGNTHDRWSSG